MKRNAVFVSQKTILITGATSGHGRWLAERLSREPDVRVHVHGRDSERCQRLAADVGVQPHVADLADLAEVRRLAAEVPRIDVLINNAGIGYGQAREVSRDGHELRFAVMYLAPVLLTRLLLPRLNPHAQVLNIGSLGQASIDFDDLQMERVYDGVTAYRRAKLALAMATFDLAAERPDLRVNVVHPATYMDTPMVRGGGGTPQNPVAHGGMNTLRVLAGSGTGTFFNEARPAEAHPDAHRHDLRARLRDVTRAMLGT